LGRGAESRKVGRLALGELYLSVVLAEINVMGDVGRRVRACAVALGLLAGCSDGGGGGANPGPEVRAVMDRAGNVDSTFPVRAYAGSISGSRAAVPAHFPEWTTLAQGGPEARAAMLEAFAGKATYESDIRLALYAYALENQLDASAASRLRSFLGENLTSDLDWTPHFITHALRKMAGTATAAGSGWYTGFEIGAAAAGAPSPAVQAALLQSDMVPPRCKKRWLVVGDDGKPLSYVDPADGKTKPIAIEGDEHASPMVPSDLAAHWRKEVANGGGMYVNDDPEFAGMPSKQFNCGGYAFRELNGGKRWTLDPHQAHRVLVGAGILEEVPAAMAKAGDKVFFTDVESSSTVMHVAEVKSVGGLISTSITLRNADQASGLWETDISSKYYTGAFLGLGTKPHYGGYKVYRYKAGKAPKMIVDPASLTNPAYCGGKQVAGQGTLEVNVDVPGHVISFRPNMTKAIREAPCPVGVTMVACKIAQIAALETDSAGMPLEVFQMAFDSGSISGPGTYAAGGAEGWNKHDGSVPVTITFLTKDFKDVDGIEPLFWSRSGSVTLTTWNPAAGGRMTGTFQATVVAPFWGASKAPNGDTITEELSATVRGSFDLPVQ
jgi:hypothetical protein